MASIKFQGPVKFGQMFTPEITLPKGKVPEDGYFVHLTVLAPKEEPAEGEEAKEQETVFSTYVPVGHELGVHAVTGWEGGPGTVRVELTEQKDGVHSPVNGAKDEVELIYL